MINFRSAKNLSKIRHFRSDAAQGSPDSIFCGGSAEGAVSVEAFEFAEFERISDTPLASRCSAKRGRGFIGFRPSLSLAFIQLRAEPRTISRNANPHGRNGNGHSGTVQHAQRPTGNRRTNAGTMRSRSLTVQRRIQASPL